MKTSFYDVKKKEIVETEVTDKKEYTVNGNKRYVLKGKTADGRNLTKFASKADYDKATA